MTGKIVEFIRQSQRTFPELIPEFKQFIDRVDASMKAFLDNNIPVGKVN
ncbi:MAG: hypothetical protein HQM08_27255 [Candidatus Riflebacteria bacterium]|nr:hypothetical protein [Candidatus Riflebacteria bacterium]